MVLAGENPAALGFWELLEYIVMEPAPTLPAEQFSPDLVDFVAKCLQKDSKGRPSVAALAAHPFIANQAPGPELRAVLEPLLRSSGAIAARGGLVR